MEQLHKDLWTTITPRKWQKAALPLIVDSIKRGERPIVSAIMGSGKSVLIAELCWLALQKLKPDQHIVVTAPRQALVNQLHATIERRCGVGKVGKFYANCKDISDDIIVCCNASAIGFSVQKARPKVAMIIGDEVHGTESERFKMAFEELNPACAVGFTATPFRSEEKQTLSLWSNVAYRYTAADALKDEVIVSWELKHWDGTGAKAEDIDKICALMIFGTEGPGIVNALDIEDAEKYAEYLEQHGYKAMAVHSRLPKHRRDAIIRKIQYGDIDIVVHVNLLSEGVDMPWLRWICLRRPVSAKVRFCQEVGRVLRAHPDKEYAYILDPHDLFLKFGLTHPERIGELLQEVDPDDELASLVKDEEQRERLRQMPPAKAYNLLESWVVQLHATLSTHELCQPVSPETLEKGIGKCNDWQQRTLKKCLWAARYLPEEQRKPFKEMIENPSNLPKISFKIADCMLKILWGLADASKEQRKKHLYWHIPGKVRLPKPCQFSSTALLFRSFSLSPKSPESDQTSLRP